MAETNVKKDQTKKSRAIGNGANSEQERQQLIKIVQANLSSCSLKILRRMARVVGATPTWVAPSTTQS